MKKSQLRQFAHVQCVRESVKKIESWSLGDLKRGRGRSKITWKEKVEKDIKILDSEIEMIENRNEWKR